MGFLTVPNLTERFASSSLSLLTTFFRSFLSLLSSGFLSSRLSSFLSSVLGRFRWLSERQRWLLRAAVDDVLELFSCAERGNFGCSDFQRCQCSRVTAGASFTHAAFERSKT